MNENVEYDLFKIIELMWRALKSLNQSINWEEAKKENLEFFNEFTRLMAKLDDCVYDLIECYEGAENGKT